jgi:hypothetical protein
VARDAGGTAQLPVAGYQLCVCGHRTRFQPFSLDAADFFRLRRSAQCYLVVRRDVGCGYEAVLVVIDHGPPPLPLGLLESLT